MKRFIWWRILFIISLAIILIAIHYFTKLSLQYSILSLFIIILLSFIIFPAHLEKQFCHSIIPILQSYIDYLQATKNMFLNQLVDHQKTLIKLETALSQSPQWVYQPGFNARLRAGYRHFLIRTEQLGEILIAMNIITRNLPSKKLLKNFASEIGFVIDQTCHLIQALITVVALQKPNIIIEDWLEDLTKMEEKFYALTPKNLTAFSLDKSNVRMVMLFENLKDMREILLKLVQALEPRP